MNDDPNDPPAENLRPSARHDVGPGERGLLSIPIGVCAALLMVAATVMATPATASGEGSGAACIQAAPVKSACP